MHHVQTLLLWDRHLKSQRKKPNAMADPLESPEWQAFSPLINLWAATRRAPSRCEPE